MRRYVRLVVVALATLAVLSVATTPAFAATQARSGLYRGKSDCGSPAHQGFTNAGRVTFVRDADSLSIDFRLRNLEPFGLYNVLLHANDSPCQFLGYFENVTADSNGKAMGTRTFGGSVSSYTQFYVVFFNPGTSVFAETTSVTLL